MLNIFVINILNHYIILICIKGKDPNFRLRRSNPLTQMSILLNRKCKTLMISNRFQRPKRLKRIKNPRRRRNKKSPKGTKERKENKNKTLIRIKKMTKETLCLMMRLKVARKIMKINNSKPKLVISSNDVIFFIT